MTPSEIQELTDNRHCSTPPVLRSGARGSAGWWRCGVQTRAPFFHAKGDPTSKKEGPSEPDQTFTETRGFDREDQQCR